MLRLPTTTKLAQHHPPPHPRKQKKNIPKIIQPRPPSLLLPPLHNLNPRNVGTVNLIPHLNTHPRQLIPQKYPRIHPPPSNIHTHARKRLPILQSNKQYIPHLRRLRIRLCKKPRPHTRGIKYSNLRLRNHANGIFTLVPRRRKRRENRDRLSRFPRKYYGFPHPSVICSCICKVDTSVGGGARDKDKGGTYNPQCS